MPLKIQLPPKLHLLRLANLSFLGSTSVTYRIMPFSTPLWVPLPSLLGAEEEFRFSPAIEGGFEFEFAFSIAGTIKGGYFLS